MATKSVLGIVLAGGAGTRLSPLTADRAKPAVPFGGLYRLIDFALSNLANGGIRKICVLTQYKSHSLDRHISTTWRMSSLLGNYVTPVPAQQRLGPHWYTGSADAIFQSMNLINDERPDIVIVFGADHVYRMDPMQLIDHHVQHGAGVTVAAIPVPRSEASAFGIVRVGADGRTIDAFLEKPADPPPMPGNPDLSYSSMGNYVFDTDVLVDALAHLTDLPITVSVVGNGPQRDSLASRAQRLGVEALHAQDVGDAAAVALDLVVDLEQLPVRLVLPDDFDVGHGCVRAADCPAALKPGRSRPRRAGLPASAPQSRNSSSGPGLCLYDAGVRHQMRSQRWRLSTAPTSACTGSAVLYIAVFGAEAASEPPADSARAATPLPHRTSPSAMDHSKTGKLSSEQAVRTSDSARTSSTVSITTIGVEELIRTFRRSSGL